MRSRSFEARVVAARTVGARVVVVIGVALAAVAVAATSASASAGPSRPTGSAATAAATTTTTAKPTIRLVQQPISVGMDERFVVVFEVTGAPNGSDIAVDIYDRIDDPSKVGADPEHSKATFDPFPLSDAPASGPVRSLFGIDLYGPDQDPPPGAWAWEIDRAGVYPVRIRVRDGDHADIATLVTQLVRRPGPGEEVRQAQVALLATVHQDPPSDPTQRAAKDHVSPTFATRLDRLDDALASHAGLPATFAVTPDTADRLVGDNSQAGVLAGLRDALRGRGRELLDAPYVDIDPAALVGAQLEGELTRQRDLGRQTLTTLLEPPTAGTWSISDPVDAGTLASLRSRGIFRLLLPTDAFASKPALSPTDLAAGDGLVRSLPVDPGYSLSDGATDPILAAHQLLARLAAAADIATSDPAIVVSIDAADADALALPILFDALTFGGPYWEAVTVDDLYRRVAAAPSHPALVTPSPADLGSYPDLSRQVHASLASLDSMLGDRTDVAGRYDRPLAISASKDLDPAARRNDVLGVEAQVRRRLSAVSTPPRDKVTLGARDARFPLIITSKLDEPIRVVIELQASDRLDFPDDRLEKTLEPGRTVASIRVRTRASGDTPVRITVRSPDGHEILAESQYTIRSTAVSGVGILLTIGAAAFLALWWGRNWYRSRTVPKHARRRAHGAAGHAADRPAAKRPSPDPSARHAATDPVGASPAPQAM
ncbi:MAG: hypothetical protein JWM89_3251 [Acidimicrobiales bacterium]|nr:hypothetical protein [Acidimicrobiales bacterium]